MMPVSLVMLVFVLCLDLNESEPRAEKGGKTPSGRIAQELAAGGGGSE
jgi:hypothetical protein